ncbi:MAG: hypothetical protein H7338_12915 [Candidatus Sericytochromatia bacterium]|nr:hypothetical protein [Candidatus Sericytochromatia bacterium]
MTPPDPAHAPRPGEGTAPPSPSPYSRGPLPPLPEGIPDNVLVMALRKYLPAINDGRKSLRAGLSETVAALMIDASGADLADLAIEDQLTGESGEVVLQEIPDVILRYWLGRVTAEQISFETFLGAIIAEGFALGYKKVLVSAAKQAQLAGGTEPDLPSPLAVLNLINQFEASSDEIKVTVAESVAERAAEMLKGGLDAHTANHLVQLLQSVAK